MRQKSDYFKQNATISSFKSNDSWVILTDIEKRIKDKIEAVGTPLKDWDINIYRGVLTGFNEAFIISGAKKEEILANCKSEDERTRTDELIRPILRGRDIKRYSYDFADLWLLYIPWHFPLHNDTTVVGASEKAEQAFSSQYPAVYNHLLKYKKQLSNRNKAETGIRYEWYALQRWGANYWEDFSKQKIAWNRIAKEKVFSLVSEGIYIQDSMHFFTGNNLKYICAFLNSKLFSWLLYIKIGEAVGGNAGNSDNIKNLKIPEPGNDKSLLILIDKLFNESDKNIIHEIDFQLNHKIYSLYNLSDDEIKYIEAF